VLQHEYHCLVECKLIIAGRIGLVKNVFRRNAMCIDDVSFLLAQVDFAVSLGGGGSHFNVAVFAVAETSAKSAVAERAIWTGVAHELQKNTVRLLAGDFKGIASKAICSLSTSVQVTACGVENSRWPSFLILGPVSKVKMHRPTRGDGASEQPMTYFPKDVDQSRGWARIEQVTNKPSRSVLPHTTKFALYLGGNESRRGPEALSRRAVARLERANAVPNAKWAQAYRR
jgi:hypothetical protein